MYLSSKHWEFKQNLKIFLLFSLPLMLLLGYFTYIFMRFYHLSLLYWIWYGFALCLNFIPFSILYVIYVFGWSWIRRHRCRRLLLFQTNVGCCWFLPLLLLSYFFSFLFIYCSFFFCLLMVCVQCTQCICVPCMHVCVWTYRRVRFDFLLF